MVRCITSQSEGRLYFSYMLKLRRHALLVGTDPRDGWTVSAFDDRRDVMAHVTPHAVSALRLAESLRFDLMLISDYVHDLELEELLAAARQDECGCRHAGIIVVVDDAKAPTAKDLLARGANRVVARSRAQVELTPTIDELMAVAPRAAVQSPVQLFSGDGSRQCHANLENISMTGMLVAAAKPYPEGMAFGFQLTLRDTLPEIFGTARVVRHARPDKEGTAGFAAVFETLEGIGSEVLASFMLFAVA